MKMEPQFVVVSNTGHVQWFTNALGEGDSMAQFVHATGESWEHWKSLGFTCQQVTLTQVAQG